MKPFLFAVACVAMAAGWIRERTATTAFRAQLATQRDRGREMESLLREQERLRALQRSADERARREGEAAEREGASARAQPDRLIAGKWLPPGAWQNRGCATPLCTVESMLWAAAGGETAALGEMLYFDGAARAKIEQIFARLPADYRARLVSPAQLVATVTTAAIPIGNAQLVWQVQNGPDAAEACVWLTLPDYRSLDSTTGPPRSSFDDMIGSTWRTGQKNIANFSLRRIDGDWRLVVPMNAVEKIEKEIGGLK